MPEIDLEPKDERLWRYRMEHEVRKLKESNVALWFFVVLLIAGLIFEGFR